MFLLRVGVAADKWTSVRSKNFFLIGNVSDGQIRTTAKNLEQFREAMGRLFPRLSQPASNETTVIVFNGDRSFEPYQPLVNGKPEKISGYFLQGRDMNYLAVSGEAGLRAVYGSYAFAVTRDLLGGVPRGVQSGMAYFFQTFQMVDKDTFHLGEPWAGDIQYLRQHSPMSVKELMELPRESPVWDRDVQRSHASSWAFVHFMMLGHEGSRSGQFEAFLKLLNSGNEVEKAFHQAFDASYEQIDKELVTYASRLSLTVPYETYHVRNPIEIDKQMEVRPLSEGQALAYLGDYLWRNGRANDAEATLKKAIGLDSKLSLAFTSLAMIRMQAKNYGEAADYFKRAVDSGTANYLVYYLRANSLRRQAAEQKSKLDDESLRIMKTSLELAIELNPQFAESYALLADVNAIRGKDFDESVDLLRKATAIFPARFDLQLYLSEALFRLRRFDEAIALAGPLSSNVSVEAPIRARALNLLKAAQGQRSNRPQH
jgi:tetratricopeptide (TPR) repeat protein